MLLLCIKPSQQTSFLFTACTPLELSWVLDVSGSLDAQDLEEIKYFVNTIQAKIGLANNNNKAAVTTFGNVAHRNIACWDHGTVEYFKNAVQHLQRFPYEFTNTRDGLEKGQYSLNNDGCGKSNAQKIIILITDGLANRGIGQERGLIEVSKAIQEAGIILLVVNPGKIDVQLKKMVPSMNIHRTFKLNYEPFVDDVTRAVCENGSPTKGNTQVAFKHLAILLWLYL